MKKIQKLSLMVFFILLMSLASVSAYHNTNRYGRYDDENPRYHSHYHRSGYTSYYRDDYYRYSNPYRKYYSYQDRYRSYYYRYHPLTYPSSMRYNNNLRRNEINIRIINSENAEVRIY